MNRKNSREKDRVKKMPAHISVLKLRCWESITINGKYRNLAGLSIPPVNMQRSRTAKKEKEKGLPPSRPFFQKYAKNSPQNE